MQARPIAPYLVSGYGVRSKDGFSTICKTKKVLKEMTVLF